MPRTPLFIALSFAVLMCAVPASATAATLQMERKYIGRDGGEDQYQQFVTYTGAPGEANRLVMTVNHERVIFEDPGAEIEVAGGCTRMGPNRAVCEHTPGDEFGTIAAELGDGADTGRIAAAESFVPSTSLGGGEGNDEIQGGIAFETLSGGPGDDLVDGGPGGDTINGGGGRDELRAGVPADGFDSIEDGDTDPTADSDVIVGYGRATYYATTVIYRSRSAPLTVDLAAGTAGAAGEQDKLVGGINHVVGGTGDDTLRGTEGDDYLGGSGGDDRIDGRGGDDLVSGQAGADRVFGGPGNDAHSNESDDAGDVEDCGSGADYVSEADARDVLRRNCEEGAWSSSIGGTANRITVQPRMARRSVTFRSTCDSSRACTGRIELRTPKSRKLLGTKRFTIPPGTGTPEEQKRSPITVPLTRLGSKRLSRGGYVRVVVSSRFDCGACLNSPPPAKHGFTTYMRR